MKRDAQVCALNILVATTGLELLLILGFATGLLFFSKYLSFSSPRSLNLILTSWLISLVVITIGLITQSHYFQIWHECNFGKNSYVRSNIKELWCNKTSWKNFLLQLFNVKSQFFYLNIPILQVLMIPLMVIKPALKSSRRVFLLMLGVVILNCWGVFNLFVEYSGSGICNYIGCTLATQVAITGFALHLTGLNLNNYVKYIAISGAVIVFLYVGVAWQAMILAERKAIELDNRLNALGIPGSREEARDNYYSGFQADEKLTNFLTNLPQSIIKLANCKDKSQLSLFVKEAQKDLAQLDNWFINPTILRLKRDYSIPFANQNFPEIISLPIIQLAMLNRIELEITRGNRAEVTRLLRLMGGVIIFAAEADAMLLSPACAINCGNIRLLALDKILDSGVLSANDLENISKRISGSKRFHLRTLETGWQLYLFAFRDSVDTYIRTLGKIESDKRHKLSPLRNFTGALLYVLIVRERNRCLKQFLRYSWNTPSENWPRFNYKKNDKFSTKFSLKKIDDFFVRLDLMEKKYLTTR